MLSIVESKRNEPSLLLDTYRYIQDKILNATIYWQCENRSCPGRAIQYGSNPPSMKKPHNHDGDEIDANVHAYARSSETNSKSFQHRSSSSSMSSNTIPSIKTLPVEIFHRIFDNLDAHTILFSIRSVCRLFRAVVSTYDRYIFDFKSISKSDFHVFCRLINPQNVISLTLCNSEYTPDQVAVFISLVRLQQFNRLHSITFLGIDECEFNIVLKRINLESLTSFSLNIRKYDNRRKKTTLNLLSSIMSQKRLRKLELEINNDRLFNISWPVNNRIEYLTMHENITCDNMYNILFNLPQLHTLIIKQDFSITKNTNVTSSFPKLTSLTIEELDATVDELESFLLLTPSLIKLKIIGEDWVSNGKRWEQFIQINLPHLYQFQFFVSANKPKAQTLDDVQLIIQSFQSSFWTESKKWFVACDFLRNRPHKIRLYSIPICKSIYQYVVSSEKVFMSTSSIKLANDPLITNNINELVLPVKETTTGYIERGEIIRTGPLFSNVTKLIVDVNKEKPLQSMNSLTTIINISQIVQLELEDSSLDKRNPGILSDIITIFGRSSSLTSLIINHRYRKNDLYPWANTIYSILPRQIKHLTIPIDQLDQIKIILERCQYLLTIQFVTKYSRFSGEVWQWFTHNTIDSMFRTRNGYNIIWIGKKIDEAKVHHKRIRLTDNTFDS